MGEFSIYSNKSLYAYKKFPQFKGVKGVFIATKVEILIVEEVFLMVEQEKLKKICEEGKWMGYTALCRELGLPVLHSGSNVQKAQMRELGRYCDWIKRGKKYCIAEVYDKPQDESSRDNVLTRAHGLSVEESHARCVYMIVGHEEKEGRIYVGRANDLLEMYHYHLRMAAYMDTERPYLDGIFNSYHQVRIYYSGEVSDEVLDEKKKECVEHLKSEGYDVFSNTWKDLKENRDKRIYNELYDTIEAYGKKYYYSTNVIIERLIKMFYLNDPIIKNNILFLARKEKMNGDQ